MSKELTKEQQNLLSELAKEIESNRFHNAHHLADNPSLQECNDANVLFMRAGAYYHSLRLTDAEKILVKLLDNKKVRDNPNYVDIRYMYVDICKRKGKPELMEDFLEEMTEAHPSTIKFMELLAEHYSQCGKFEDARKWRVFASDTLYHLEKNTDINDDTKWSEEKQKKVITDIKINRKKYIELWKRTNH